MKRRLCQSYRPSPALLRAQRRLAWRSAGGALLLLALLASGAAFWALPGLFLAGGHAGSFVAVPYEAPDEVAEALPTPPPPDSPAPTLADMQPLPPELLPVESPEPIEPAGEDWAELPAEPLLQLAEASATFRPPATSPKPAAQTAATVAAKAAAKPAAPGATAGGGKLIAASYRSAPKPPYPPALRSSRVEGRVGVRIAIDAQGRPTHVDITAPSGHTEFDRTARSWIMGNWRFNPATRDGAPIPSTVTTRVEFVIN